MPDPLNPIRQMWNKAAITDARDVFSRLRGPASRRINDRVKELCKDAPGLPKIEGLDGLMQRITGEPDIGRGATRPETAIDALPALSKLETSDPDERLRRYLTNVLGVFRDEEVGNTKSTNDIYAICRAIRATDTLNRAGARKEIVSGDGVFRFDNATPSDLVLLQDSDVTVVERRPGIDYREDDLSDEEKTQAEAMATVSGSGRNIYDNLVLPGKDSNEAVRLYVDKMLALRPELNFKEEDKDKLYELTAAVVKEMQALREEQPPSPSQVLEAVSRIYDIAILPDRKDLGETDAGEGSAKLVQSLGSVYGKLELRDQDSFETADFNPSDSERASLAASVSKAAEEVKGKGKEKEGV